MTTIDVRKVKAGQAVDLACAEAMGIKVVHHSWPCGFRPDGCRMEAAAFVNDAYEPEHSYWYDRRCPVYASTDWGWPPTRMEKWSAKFPLCATVEPVLEYSTDIGNAWKLVEAMSERNWLVQIECDSERVCVELFEEASGLPSWWISKVDVEADTAPLAICCAFLLANGIKELETSDDSN